VFSRSTVKCRLQYSDFITGQNIERKNVVSSLLNFPLPGLVLDDEGEPNGEDRVGPAGLAVHVRGGDRPRLVALHDQIVNFLGGDDKQLKVNSIFSGWIFMFVVW